MHGMNEPVNWHFHKIEAGLGKVALDEYAVLVEKLPIIDGKESTPEGLLKYWRLNINKFVNTSVSSFEPHEPSDKIVWESDHPVGAVILIRIPKLGITVERAAVVVSEASPDHWIFTTVWTTTAAGHPVSGNRLFGFRKHGDNLIYFTRGVDRVSELPDYLNRFLIQNGQKSLWNSLETRFVEFVNASQGQASLLPSYLVYIPWDDPRIQDAYNPSVEWEPIPRRM
jgi:hypothetical protein